MLAGPMLLAAVLAGAYLAWQPPSADLAAQTYRADLFADHGFLVWSNDWYGGLYLPGYSLVYPPLGAWLGPRLAGALACVAAAGLFAALAHGAYGRRARLGALWFGAATVTMLLSGRITFALGVAVGLGALLALQRGRTALAAALAVLTAAASPVAALFVAIAAAGVALGGDRRALWVAAAALAAAAGLALTFPTPGTEPFVVSSFVAIPLAALGAWALLPGYERELRWGFAVYAAVAVAAFVIPNPIGGNLARLGALFAGPVFALALWPRHPGTLLLVAVPLVFWQLTAPVRDVATALGDPSTEAPYYAPLLAELRARTGGAPVRIEVPPTQNRGEAAYVAPEFPLARGWLRQLESGDFDRFRDGGLTAAYYRRWLDRRAVSYVAVAGAELDYLADDEVELIDAGLPYLRKVWADEDWTLYAVRDPVPLASPAGRLSASLHAEGGRSQKLARLVAMDVDSFELEARRRGGYVVRVRYNRFWRVAAGRACIAKAGEWTRVEVRRPGRVLVEAPPSLRGLFGTETRC